MFSSSIVGFSNYLVCRKFYSSGHITTCHILSVAIIINISGKWCIYHSSSYIFHILPYKYLSIAHFLKKKGVLVS